MAHRQQHSCNQRLSQTPPQNRQSRSFQGSETCSCTALRPCLQDLKLIYGIESCLGPGRLYLNSIWCPARHPKSSQSYRLGIQQSNQIWRSGFPEKGSGYYQYRPSALFLRIPCWYNLTVHGLDKACFRSRRESCTRATAVQPANPADPLLMGWLVLGGMNLKEIDVEEYSSDLRGFPCKCSVRRPYQS